MDAAAVAAVKATVAVLLAGGDSVSFTLNGSGSYKGCRTTLKAERVNTDMGLAGVYECSIVAASAQFATVTPKEKDILAFSGRNYRLLSVETDAIAASYKLNLGPEFAR